jgi:hypothetical protein
LAAKEFLAALQLAENLDKSSHFDGNALLFEKLPVKRSHGLFLC